MSPEDFFTFASRCWLNWTRTHILSHLSPRKTVTFELLPLHTVWISTYVCSAQKMGPNWRILDVGVEKTQLPFSFLVDTIISQLAILVSTSLASVRLSTLR